MRRGCNERQENEARRRAGTVPGGPGTGAYLAPGHPGREAVSARRRAATR